MTDSITPPPELVQQWDDEGTEMLRPEYQLHLTTRAAQWGADQEFDACCSLINLAHSDPAATGDHRLVDKTVLIKQLRAIRRPKPPSLKEQALTALTRYTTGETILTSDALDTIRRALEQLDD